MEDIKKSLLKYALQNGVKFDTVNPSAVISKVIGDHPSAKTKMKEVNVELKKIIEDVNSMDKEERIEKLKEIAPELLEEKKHEAKEGLKDLPNVKGKVVLRLCPSPSGPLHIGHGYVYGLNALYKQKYGAKLIFRLEDTNPDNIEPMAYTAIKKDFDWLTENGIDETYIQSERMEIYYEYAIKLLEEGHAYICDCDTEEFKQKMLKSISCECRDKKIDEQLKRWYGMLNDYDEGSVVMRFKTNINDPNPAMRDFPLMRINLSEHPHVGKKYRVWPLMNFSVAIDDMDMEITHAIRGKDHEDNAKRQVMIHQALKANSPETVIIGRVNLDGFNLSTSWMKEEIKQGAYTGWDDIRLPTMMALKRKGYKAEAIRKFASGLGVTKTDKTVNKEEFFKSLNSFNKEIIDPVANRYYCVQEPVVISIDGAPKLEFEQELHPTNNKKGRPFVTHTNFYIEKKDYDNIDEGELIRLMGCLNFVKEGDKFRYISKEYGAFKENGKKQIHWLPEDQKQLTKVKIKLDDNTDVECFAEKGVENVKVNDIIQFERFGFCRCDAKNSFWFTHR